MVLRRILYLLTLGALLAFRLTNPNYLARFLLVLCLALPVLSLLLALPAALGCRVSLTAQPGSLRRDEPGLWLVTVESGSGLPLPRLYLRLEEVNLLTGEKTKHKHTLAGDSGFSLLAGTDHCGLLALRAKRLLLWDCLGLFRLPVRRPQPARLLVAPVPSSPGPLNLPEGQGQRTARGSAATHTTGEDHDLRDYRPGDSMRSVHWKLSSKWDDLIVREPAPLLLPFPLLLVDRFGPPEEFDRTLDRLLGYSHALLEIQRPHGVLWLEGEESRYCPISGERALTDCLYSLLDHPRPLSGLSPAHCPELIKAPDGPLFPLPISQREEGQE